MKVLDQISPALQEKLQTSDTKFDKLVQNIGIIMENTRQTYGYSQRKFSDMLGISFFQYRRLLTGEAQHDILKGIFKFCYVFGYDLQSLSKNGLSTQDTDMALLEVASSFGSVPDATFADIVKAITQSNAMRTQEKNMVVNAIYVYLAERAKFQAALSENDFPILTAVETQTGK